MVEDLVQWLGEQLDADEKDAEAWRGIFPSPGVDDDGAVWLHVRPGGNAVIVRYRDPAAGYDDMAKLRSWAGTEGGWTQERVLREIDAKRRILAECAHWHDKLAKEVVDPSPVPFPALGEVLDAVTPVLRALALPYADRPGYREEWRP
jgi:hypothetical protein